MKKIYRVFLAAAALFAGCEEFQPVFTGKYPDPQEQYIYTDADFGEFTSIADVKAMYAANGDKPYVVDKECVIKGQVTTSDQVGNLYKSLYIQDETAGIEIKIGKNGLYNEYKLGQWLYIDCSGLTVGDYNGMINIGYEDPTREYETGYLEHAYIIDQHVFKGEYADPVEPVVITEADLHKKVNLGRLVTIKDLKYDDHIFILAYVDPNGNRKDYNNNGIFIDEEGPDNYGVTTWACSEQKWKEYLLAGNFDSVEAAGTTVGQLLRTTGIGSMAYSVSQYFKMGKTDVQVRTSGYARFADTEIPQDVLDGKATVSFTGILTEYKGAAQFTLIDLDGVKKADGTNWY
ncbi:MAG: hypothetical protein IJ023_05350 [Bacteroidales bacterium]|nr:hypothetical protein [Bacteroidales bacterium]